MFAASKTGGVVASSGDPYWTSVSLLTNFENNLSFQDGSTNNFAITRTGVVNPSLNTPFSGGVGGSEYFNGSTGYLTIPNNAVFQFGTGDFTAEAWIYLVTKPINGRLFSLGNFSGAGNFQVEIPGSTGNDILIHINGAFSTYTYTVPLTTWFHIAVCRVSGTVKVYINGTSLGSNTQAGSVNDATNPFAIGAQSNGSALLNGCVSNVRIVKGTAVYTANFTPPTAPLTAITNTSLLITGTGQGMYDNSTFVDQGPNALTITATGAPVYSGRSPFGNTYPGSVLFNGTSQYVTAPDNAALNMGAADFTLEAWIYLTSTPALQANAGANVINKDGKFLVSWAQYNLYVNSALKVCANFSSVPNGGAGPTATIVGTTTLSLNTWYYVAVTRSGVNGTVWVNGSSNGTTTSIPATLANGARALHIGYEESQAAFAYFPGYISNARIVKGTAVYTANFTPSTTPLTAITNTSLLVRGDTGAFYDLSNVGNPESGTGSAVVTTQVKKFGNESGSFNNSTTYITAPDNTSLNMGAADFTVECWVYLNATPSAGQIIFSKDGKSAVSWAQYELSIDTAKKINAIISTTTTSSPPGAPTVRIIGATILNTGQWYFVALTRVGVNATLWVGGVSDGTSSAVPATLNTRNGSLYVGFADSAAANNIFNGYLDDIRITKGVARYTANFTPPTVTFPTGP